MRPGWHQKIEQEDEELSDDDRTVIVVIFAIGGCVAVTLIAILCVWRYRKSEKIGREISSAALSGGQRESGSSNSSSSGERNQEINEVV